MPIISTVSKNRIRELKINLFPQLPIDLNKILSNCDLLRSLGHLCTKQCLFLKFRKYAIKDSNSGQTLKLRLCDTRGLEEDSSVDPQDIVYILDGNVPDRYQVQKLCSWYLQLQLIYFITFVQIGSILKELTYVLKVKSVTLFY